MEKIAPKKIRSSAQVRNRFLLIAIVMVIAIAGMLVIGDLGLETLSSLRAYVGAESIYSKAQQGAAFILLHYANTKDPKYYEQFLEHIQIPLGDQKARLELEKPDPDLHKAFDAFKQGGNHPQDIEGLIDIFLDFRNFEYVDKAIAIWMQADHGVSELKTLGQELHDRVRSDQATPENIEPIVNRIISLNQEMEEIEKEFSDTLGEASRWVKSIFIRAIVAFAIISAIGCIAGLWFVKRLLSDIQKNSADLEMQNWLKSGQAALNERMREAEDLPKLSREIVSYVCEYLDAGIGAIYVAQDEDQAKLKMMASYAYEKRKRLSQDLEVGEGLVGQAALEKKPIVLTDCPNDYIAINSSLGASPPRSILVYPLIQRDTVNGVIELGSFQEFTKRDLEFLALAGEIIAVALGATMAREKEAVLLEKTQQQAEELTAQQEELRATNEELQQYVKDLEATEQKLQAQQEELRVTNEELTEQAQNLEEQKAEIEEKSRALESLKSAAEEKSRELELTGKYKSEFLANMSHELRTPLNSILLLSKLLSENKDNNLTAKQTEFAKTIHSSGSDLLDLINDVLDLSKVEAGKLELNTLDFELQQLTEKLHRTYDKIADEKDIEFTTEIDRHAPSCITTDFQRVEQILKNFISNALKFTNAGKVSLRIARPDKGVRLLNEGLSAEQSIAFSVSDTGIGIDPKKQQLIFEAFQQADGSTNRKYGGTGLGLSISKELAKHLGGEIQLASTEGQGSTFTLYLPERLGASKTVTAAEQNTEMNERESGRETSEPPVPEKATGMDDIRDDRRELSPDDKSVLIIEDDVNFSKTLKELAQEKGFKVLVAGDGETGLHMADYYQPSAIILDIGLPGIDGWGVMTRLKESARTRHIPVHFITGTEKTSDARKMGAVSYFVKPLSMEQLNQVLSAIEDLIDMQVKQLLVVEGDDAESDRIRRTLKEDDIAIDVVSTGSDALARLNEKTYHLIVLGTELSDMRGVELLRKIRDDDSMSHIPIVVYAEKALTSKERVYLDGHSERIITKEPKALERLFDETVLFMHRVEADLPENKQRILKMAHDKRAILNGKKLLIVDDDMRNVFALTSILEEMGISVLAAKNGREGINLVKENADLDLVLMDIMMPEMDGYEAMREIRRMPNAKNLPIIALTAKAMRGDRAKCIEAGASDYLSKPVDSDKLLSMLRVWLYR